MDYRILPASSTHNNQASCSDRNQADLFCSEQRVERKKRSREGNATSLLSRWTGENIQWLERLSSLHYVKSFVISHRKVKKQRFFRNLDLENSMRYGEQIYYLDAYYPFHWAHLVGLASCYPISNSSSSHKARKTYHDICMKVLFILLSCRQIPINKKDCFLHCWSLWWSSQTDGIRCALIGKEIANSRTPMTLWSFLFLPWCW